MASKQWMFVEASVVTGVAAFIKDAFGAKEVERYVCLKKKKAEQEAPFPFIVELKIEGETVTVADHEAFRVQRLSRGMDVFRFQAEDFDAVVKNAEKAGAVHLEMNEGIGGSRMAQLLDPFGHSWAITEA